MPGRISVKCAVSGCYRRKKMTRDEREELRRIGAENNASAGLVCPSHVEAAFNFELEDVDLDVPLEEYLVEVARDTPRWRVMLTPLRTKPAARYGPVTPAPEVVKRDSGREGGEAPNENLPPAN